MLRTLSVQTATVATRGALSVVLTVGCCLLLSACASSDGNSRASERARGVLVISTPPDAGTTHLQRLDADTLAPRGRASDLGEYHGAWAFAPDRRKLAVGTFLRTGVRLVDVSRLRIVRDIPTSVAVVGVGWISSTRIAVLLQRGGLRVIDTRTGRVEKRWNLEYRPPCGAQRQVMTPYGPIFLVVSARTGAVRLIRVSGPAGTLRVVALRGVKAPSNQRACGAPAFTTDPSRKRALVIASHGPIAEVATRSLEVTYHDSPDLRTALGQRDDCAVCTGRRTAVWPVPHTVAIGGVNASNRRDGTPVGVSIVDTTTWSARLLDPIAGDLASSSEGTLLSFGGARLGLRATTLAGEQKWVALPGKRIRVATVASDRVYVLDDPPRVTRVLDNENGELLSSRPRPLGRLETLDGRTDSGDAIP